MFHEIQFSVCANVVPFLSSRTKIALSQTCAIWRKFLADFVAALQTVLRAYNPSQDYIKNYGVGDIGLKMLYKHATKTGRQDICELVREWINTQTKSYACAVPLIFLFDYAAREHNVDLCVLARTWLVQEQKQEHCLHLSYDLICQRETCYTHLLRGASRRGYEDLYDLVERWASDDQTPLHWHAVGNFAALHGQINLCFRLATRKRADIDWNVMLASATSGSNRNRARELCYLIRQWSQASQGVLVYDKMLQSAITYQNRELFEVALMWAREKGDNISWTDLAEIAATTGNLEICHLLRDWQLQKIHGVDIHWEFALSAAEDRNCWETIHLIKKWLKEDKSAK